MKFKEGPNYLITWGKQPEDFAKNPFQIGSAILFNEDDYALENKEEDEYLLISKPSKHLEYKITSANEMEKKLNNIEVFEEYVKGIKINRQENGVTHVDME